MRSISTVRSSKETASAVRPILSSSKPRQSIHKTQRPLVVVARLRVIPGGVYLRQGGLNCLPIFRVAVRQGQVMGGVAAGGVGLFVVFAEIAGVVK